MNTIKREGFDLRSMSGVPIGRMGHMEAPSLRRRESFMKLPAPHLRGRVRKFNENQISHPNKCISSTSHACVYFSFECSRTKSKEIPLKSPEEMI